MIPHFAANKFANFKNNIGMNFPIVVGLSLLAFVLLLKIFWVGFLGSDDASYWAGATGWLTKFPYVGDGHWALRHTVVIPIALARLIFGDGMTAMFLPTVLFALGLIVLLALWTLRSVGITSVVPVVALVITDPQLVILSSTADVDMAELFFVMLAFFILDKVYAGVGGEDNSRARNSKILTWRLLAIGALLGLAMLSRETAIFAVATVGVLFLAGYGMDRRFYLLIGAGFFIIIGLEFAYLWGMTGNLLYRFTIDINHDSNINRWADQGAAIPFVHPLIDPVIMLLLNHNFGLLAWIGIPLTIWLFRANVLTGAARRMAILLVTLALIWTVLAAGLWKLLPLTPRYYLLASVALSVLSGIALAQIWQRGRTYLAVALGIMLVFANIFALSADNRNFMFGEYTLVKLASLNNATIHTDPETSRRVDLLLKWNKTRDRVTSTLPEAGDLFFYNPIRAYSGLRPGADWRVVDRRNVPESGGRWLACHLPASFVPPAMLGKLGCGNVNVTLYRIPAKSSS